MKHLLLTLEFPPVHGGVATYLENLAHQIPSDDILVIAPADVNSEVFDAKKNYKIERWDNLNDWKSLIFKLKKFIKLNQIDHLIISHILPFGYLALMLGIPYSLILHGMDIRLTRISWLKKILTGIILKHAKTIIVNSNDTKKIVDLYGDYSTKTVVAYPCPKDLLNIPYSTEKEQELIEKYFLNKEVILSVNRLVKRKGNDMVIKSLPRLIATLPNISYIIIGSGAERVNLEHLAVELSVSNHVLFLENISDKDLPYFYKNAKIFVMPARIEKQFDVEGFGIVYLEAALFGTPSIAGNVGGSPEAVINNETGITVEPNSIDEISSAIELLLDDQGLRQSLGATAKDRTLSDFIWKKQLTPAIEKFYKI